MFIVSPERRTDSSTLIVQSNVFAAHPRGDSFGDATYLANKAGVDVLLAERPFTGFDPILQMRHKRLSGIDYENYTTDQAEEIDAIVTREGYQIVKMIGRSAAASHLLTLTKVLASTDLSTQVAQTLVFEPVGMFKTNPTEGEAIYKQYIAHQKAMRKLGNLARENNQPDPYVMPESTDRTDKIKRLAEMAWGAFIDKKFYSDVWSEDAALQTIETIAQNKAQTRVDVVFAEHSMVLGATSQEDTEEKVATLQDTLLAVGNSHVSVSIEPRTLHESGDLRSFMYHLAIKHSLLP